MLEPPIEWDESLRHEDLSTWYEVEGVTRPACCEQGWLPLPDGTMIACWRHDDGNRSEH